MKRKFAIVLLLALVGFQPQAQIVKQYGQLQVKGTHLTDQSGNIIALHGMSFGWSNFHPRFYTAGTVHTLVKDWHSTVIRASIGIELERGFFQDSAGNTQCIINAVDAAIKEDVYVIIDWHSHNINLEAAKVFFNFMAKKYGKNPHVIYELFNEPDKETWPEVKAYALEIIKVIRAIDPDNIILVGCPTWDQDVNLPAADPIVGYNNLMYTMHFYAGTHEKWLRDRTDAAIKAGLPIFVSECAGMESSGDGPLNEKAWFEYVNWMNENHLSWAAWSVSDKNETCSVLNTSASSNGNWSEDDIKAWGQLARKTLKMYQ
jgi:endoglucanase